MEAIYWLVAMIVFLVIEAVTVSVVTIWFAVGALAALITCLLGGSIWVQFGLFLVVSGIFIAALRPVVKRYLTPKITKTNVDTVIGMECYVTTAIDNLNAAGQVKLSGMPWTARSVTGETIPEGTLVRVEHIEGVKLFVAPVEVPVGTK